jgi:perosamine synthetase
MEDNDEYLLSLEPNSAIVIVHNLGNIINVPRLRRIRPDLIFIEDNCEGLFGKYEGQYSGTASLCSAVSFYGNKTITTGEGGAFFTDDKEIYDYINSIYSHGMTQKRYIHNNIATNFRMTNIQAGFLYDQLNDIEHIINLKQNIFNNYNLALTPLIQTGKVKLFKNEDNTQHSQWMYSICIPSKTFDEIDSYFKQNEIEVRPIFYDIHCHNHLKNIKNNFDITETNNIINSSIMLPSFPELSTDDITKIINILCVLLN